MKDCEKFGLFAEHVGFDLQKIYEYKDLSATKMREDLEREFAELGISIRWEGEGVHEKGYDMKSGKLLVDVNPEFYRPAEVEFLWGNASKAEKELGWKRKVDFRGLVSMMMDADLREVAGISCAAYRQKNGGNDE